MDGREAVPQRFLDELNWPEELFDREWMRREAKTAAEANEKYGFKSPEELGYAQTTGGKFSTTADRYVKQTSSGPVARQPPPVHECVDNVQVMKSKKRPATADTHLDEHPRIEAAKDIHGYAPPSVIDLYHDQPHDAVLPTAGIAPEDRPQMNKELRAFERQNGLTGAKGLSDPIAQKRRKTQSQARLAVKAAAPLGQVMRNSDRVRAQQKTSHQDALHVGAQNHAPGAAAMMASPAIAAQSGKPPALAQETQATKKNDLQEVAAEMHKAGFSKDQRLMPFTPAPSVKATNLESLEGTRPAKKAVTQTIRSQPSVIPATNRTQTEETSVTKKRKPEDDDASEPSKRPRVNHACDKCREKKTKCNGCSPCEACIRRGSDCIYSDGPAPVLNSKIKKECARTSARVASTGAISADASSTKPASTESESQKALSRKAAPGSALSAGAAQAEASSRNTSSTKPQSSRQGRACDQCRSKKTKCDGDRPCEACSRRNFTCTYGEVEALSKLKEFEDSGPSGPPDAPGPSAPGPANRDYQSRGPAGSAGSAGPASDTFSGSSTQTYFSKHGQKSNLVEGRGEKISSHLAERAKVTLRLTAHAAKLRSASGFETLNLSGIPQNIQKSIKERLGLKMRDMMIWKIHRLLGQCPEWNIDNRLQEESFHNRPSIKLVIPDLLKGLLVDDWENVTKSGQYVELPHQKATVQKILDDYLAVEKPNREAGSTQMDILEETIDGLREYFDKALGRILLYR